MRKISPSRRRFLAGAAACAVAPAFSLAGANPARMELTAGNSAHSLRGDDAPPVSLWTFNNASPGPLLRGRRGDSLRIRLVNKMKDAATSIHWHGVRVDNAMDGAVGVTQPAVPPGEFFDYEVALPDSGSFWYHSHNQSWEQVARGLYGPLLVDDPDDPPVDRDLVLMIDDWKMSPVGGLDEQSFGHLGEWSHGGRLGNWLTVNSAPEPTYEVPAGGRIRLRLMNPANARIFRLALPPQMEAKIVALDGMPIAPRDFPEDGLTLAPAQRVDVVSDLPQSPGAHVIDRAVRARSKRDGGDFEGGCRGGREKIGGKNRLAVAAQTGFADARKRRQRRCAYDRRGDGRHARRNDGRKNASPCATSPSAGNCGLLTTRWADTSWSCCACVRDRPEFCGWKTTPPGRTRCICTGIILFPFRRGRRRKAAAKFGATRICWSGATRPNMFLSAASRASGCFTAICWSIWRREWRGL